MNSPGLRAGAFSFRQVHGQDVDAGRHQEAQRQADHASASGDIDEAFSAGCLDAMQFLVEGAGDRKDVPLEKGNANLPAMRVPGEHQVVAETVRHDERRIRIVCEQQHGQAVRQGD